MSGTYSVLAAATRRLVPVLAFFCLFFPDLAAALPPGQHDFVVVTTESLVPELTRLTDHREAQGLTSRIVTVEWIDALGLPGVDAAARLRGFLAECRSAWGTSYVLLGGGADLVPVRYARTDQWPPLVGSDFLSDLYFACLDGDWDGDGDGRYGEAQDDPDLLPELAIGRAPLRTAADAAVFVDKILAYEALRQGPAARRALLMADAMRSVGDPGQILYDFAEFAEELRLQLGGATPPVACGRLYGNADAWPGATVLTRQAALDSLGGGGYGWAHFYGQASREAWQTGPGELLTIQDLGQLANDGSPLVLCGQAVQSACFDSACVLVTALLDPDGGCVAGLGHTSMLYVVAGEAIQSALYGALCDDGVQRLGDALRQVHAAIADQPAVSLLCGQGFALLGDPTLEVGPFETTGAGGEPAAAVVVSALACRPNPFNPGTTVRFTLAPGDGEALPVTISIHDAWGRRVAVLRPGSYGPGEHAVDWDGRGDDGAPLPSGIYVVRLDAAGAVARAKVTLLK